MLRRLFGGHSGKVPPPGSYGPATGEVDHQAAANLAQHYQDYPACTGAWIEVSFWGDKCYHCGRGV
jgi:hypothetical protein